MKDVLGSESLRWLRVRLVPILLGAACTAAAGSSGDERILAAREAARVNDRAKLAQLVASGSGHPLDAYVEYWSLKAQLETLDAATVLDFLKRNQGAYLAERLRGEWLKDLGKQRNWPLFDQHFPAQADPDQELKCYALHSRYLGGDKEAEVQAKALWLSADLPDACHQLMLALIAEGRVGSDETWERLRRLAEGKRLSAAKAVGLWLPPAEQPDGRSLEIAVNNPVAYLDRLPKNFSINRAGRELAEIAVARLARNDAAGAASRWQSIAQRFSSRRARLGLQLISATTPRSSISPMRWPGTRRPARRACRMSKMPGRCVPPCARATGAA